MGVFGPRFSCGGGCQVNNYSGARSTEPFSGFGRVSSLLVATPFSQETLATLQSCLLSNCGPGVTATANMRHFLTVKAAPVEQHGPSLFPGQTSLDKKQPVAQLYPRRKYIPLARKTPPKEMVNRQYDWGLGPQCVSRRRTFAHPLENSGAIPLSAAANFIIFQHSSVQHRYPKSSFLPISHRADPFAMEPSAASVHSTGVSDDCPDYASIKANSSRETSPGLLALSSGFKASVNC